MVHELGYRDKVIIPDKYNTGCNPALLVPVEQVISGWNTYLYNTIFTTLGTYTLENVLFTGTINFKSNVNHPVTFKNCKFDGLGTSTQAFVLSGQWGDNNAWIFENCEFTGYGSNAFQPHDRCVAKNCYFHHMGADGAKAFSNGGYENCYFYELGLGAGAHADGIQTTIGIENFYVKNCRFDMPATASCVSNSGIFFFQESGDAVDCELSDILIEGGGYAVYLGLKNTSSGYEITDLVGRNIKIGHNYHYNLFLCNYAEYEDWVNDGIISTQDKIFVSSVYKGTDGKIKVHATNYTTSDRTMVMVTDKETKSVTVPANYNYSDGIQHEIEDFNFDVEFECDGDYVICYDTSVSDANEIRFQYCSVKKLFTDIADTIRSKTGDTDEIYRCNLPKEIDGLDVPATLTAKSIVANGTYTASSDNADGYSSVTVTVPQSTLTTKSITANGTYNAQDDNADGYSSVTVNVSGGGLPSYMSVSDLTINADAESIEFNYDATKTPLFIVATDSDPDTESRGYSVLGISAQKKNTDDTFICYQYANNYQGAVAGGTYGTCVLDSNTGKVTLTGRGGSYLWRAGRTYRIVIIYEVTT